jgi:hypothetical protein
MSRTPYFISRWLAISTLTAATAAVGLTGCRTVTTAPANVQLAGLWIRDKAASDDADAKIVAAVAKTQAELRRRLNRMGYGGGAPPGGVGGGENAPGGPEAPPDESFDGPGDRYGGPGQLGPDFRDIRIRLLQTLRPPSELKIEVEGDLVQLAADRLPARDYRLGERISRFDEYGTAIIDATWSSESFVLRWRYTSHGSRSERYEVDRASGALTLTQQIVDPYVGKIAIRSVYRRG